MNVLVTCGRFHAATDIVRALHAAGARVDVVDPYKLSPALHSRNVDAMHVVASPASAPLDHVADIAKIVRRRKIDLIVPTYEDGFYLANYAEMLPAPVFGPNFETIAKLHNKSRFLDLCRDFGLQMPKTQLVANREELRSATDQFDDFVARPVYSRGGQVYLTNHGPRAGETTVDDCDPSAGNPWLVQDYVEGTDACSLSIVRDGKVVVHCAYEPTIAAPGGYSVQFSSVEDFGTLDITSAICGELGYNGFVGFDYRRTPDGLVMIECNPRSSAGVFLFPHEWISDAILGEPEDLRIVPPGIKRQCDGYMLNRHVVSLPAHQLVHELLTTPDLYISAKDMLPAVYFFLCQRHWSHVAKREHTSFGWAFLSDVSWNGEPMPAMDQSRTSVGEGQ
jgi:glutathione synthase/RimK-type ligase-like ATP-grasp enzyme